ncbi:trypsin-like peptidase domain-containing protein [Candidatus Nitrosocosmicus franklandus]|uniref:Periplasmic pH-dependent serine endoprotease DegQ n=1 Tax=Candidatus Nitrosocosmicus franklandianus TaxID=1798806 RepID=A0A484IE79_9ARCH|nr:trypsin-like peptidase domain-containing protein [Candidatus Nitrosocosmicus franklandus]VFJ13962.1 Periplasmic pH-dependent serine endoprotease DegQ [Candidatus Nitrosocosmicus franklandus]
MSYNTKLIDKSEFLMSFVAIVVVTLSLGFYFIPNANNLLVTGNYTFIDAFAQQQQTSLNITKNDNNSTNINNNNNNTISSSNSFDQSLQEDLIKLYDKVEHSVVQVTQDSNLPGASRLGSGFVYDKEGHIVTNYHVVAGDTINREFDVTFTDGTGYKATVVGVDPFAEIAVLKIDVENNIEVIEKLEPLSIGNFSEVDVGQRVAAIGNPFGLSASITEGIVSGLGRVLPALPSENSQRSIIEDTPAFSIPDIIQTDAAINPGNSGGPLLNMKGEVIGINTAIFSATGVYSGVGFAIPSYLIQKVVPSIIATGEYQHPYLGVSGTDINSDIAEMMNLQNTTGFLVIQVTSGSPAEKAGIRGGSILTEIDGREIELGGDVIIGIDDKSIRKIDDLLSYLDREKKVGENVTLTVIRNGQVQEIDLTLAARPNSTIIDNALTQEIQDDNNPSLGITGINVTPEIARQMNVPSSVINGGEKGFLVIDVLRNGSAEEAGIRGGYITSNINGNQIELGGDIILEIENITIGSVEDIRKVLSTKQVGDSVQLTVYRDNDTVEIPVILKAGPKPDQTENILPPFSPNIPRDEFPFQQPFNPFDDFSDDIYNQCVQIVGKEACDRLFGR